MKQPMSPEIEEANKAQIDAANPEKSRIASANAGSGKTKVLVDRVTRLLIGGTKPEKILCLTYTKAAANEMQNRLFEKLGDWSVMAEGQLNEALNTLLGGQKIRSKQDIAHARGLFANALETPDGLKVQTIHAFCERVLGRFPIEAGIQPGYDPIDEIDTKAIRKTVELSIYAKAWAAPESELAKAIQIVAGECADQTLEKLIVWMADNVDEIKTWEAEGGLKGLASLLELDPEVTVAEIKRRAWEATPHDRVRSAAQAMLGSSPKDIKLGEKVLRALKNSHDPQLAFDLYAAGFMTQKRVLVAAPVTNNGPLEARELWGIKHDIRAECHRLAAAFNDVLGAQILQITGAIYTIACEFIKGYEAEKTRMRGLDFNDQVIKVRDLLTNADQSAWVQYKLDGGIDHILVDEAQDTAPNQWTIIDQLKDAFEPADPAALFKNIKTFFAVGDEKQSIYSFQGARPESFITRMGRMATLPDTEKINMKMSFRSSPDILRFVDAVFADNDAMNRMFDRSVIDHFLDPVTHTAFRDDRGLVEIWPLAPKPQENAEEDAWDTTPVDALGKASSREQLAKTIALKIKSWLDRGEPVYDRDEKKTRPMRADDILILVRGRTPFFDAVIRNLKAADVAVAGADRLVISDSVVVKDLLALTRFVLLPSDDLALAEVLRSPLIDLSEEQLFDICFDRGERSVWESLKSSSANYAREAAMSLTTMIGFSRQYAPFEFYRRVLDVMDESGTSRLSRVYKRLSMEAQDALEAFLNRALAHQRQSAPSLQHFLQSMLSDTQDIKREMDNAQGEVRVMTVHGAKGLEAPVVILPDTTQLPKGRNTDSLLPVDGGWVYLPSTNDIPAKLSDIAEAVKARRKQEYLRLLYVAMTRAESRLVLCGFHSGSGATGMEKECWYKEALDAMALLPHHSQDFGDWGEIKVFGAAPQQYTDISELGSKRSVDLPEWALIPASEDTQMIRRVTPSHLLAGGKYSDIAVRSPLSQAVDRFRRGNLTHKLLEILPEIQAGRRRAAAEAFLAKQKDVSTELKSEIHKEVMAVIEHPDYAPFFSEGSRAEVNLAGQGKGLNKHLRLNAQIDRLAVTDTHVYIIDYKSNRPPPNDIKDVPPIYWGQMAAYREMIKITHPGRTIICALLWTDGPDLMILPDEGLDSALTEINSVPT